MGCNIEMVKWLDEQGAFPKAARILDIGEACLLHATPDDIVSRLNGVMQQIIADPALVQSWAGTGVAAYPPEQQSPAAARALLKSEIERWGRVVHDNNIQGQM